MEVLWWWSDEENYNSQFNYCFVLWVFHTFFTRFLLQAKMFWQNVMVAFWKNLYHKNLKNKMNLIFLIKKSVKISKNRFLIATRRFSLKIWKKISHYAFKFPKSPVQGKYLEARPSFDQFSVIAF